MSDTPITDAARFFVQMSSDPNSTPAEFVDAIVCEKLERELSAMTKERDAYLASLQGIASGAVKDAMHCIRNAREVIAKMKGGN